MKKFMNTAGSMVASSLDGFVRAHEDLVVFGPARNFVRRRALVPGKVAVISGGGAGHEPMHIGFVGKGMLDAACTGHVFTSPTPDQIVAAIKDTDTGAGCLLLVKNYDGDVMNFEMAAEMAGATHRIETVVIRDDTALAGSPRSQGRRGVAGTLVVEKLIGAAAETGMGLGDLKRLGDRLGNGVRTMGVALRGVTLPETKRATFRLGDDEIEMGVGIHGEPGRSRERFTDADTMIETLCRTVSADLQPRPGDEALLFVNGFGGTPASELYLAFNVACGLFERQGVRIVRSLVGTYVTSLDMAGLSVTLCLLGDAERRLWDAPVATTALRWG